MSRSRAPAELPIVVGAVSPAPPRQRFLFLAKVLLAAGILGWLCTGRLDFGTLAAVPLSFDLVVLVAIVFGSLLLPAVRWWWLLRIQQVDASLWQVTKLTWIGYASAVILPGAASGDVAKSYLMVRGRPTARARSLSTVVVDRVIGVYSLILLGAASALWFVIARQEATAAKVLLGISVVFLVGSLIGATAIVFGPWRRLCQRFIPALWIEAWSESYLLYRTSKRALVGCLVLSLVSSALTAASLTAADRALGGDVSWSSSLLVGPLIVLANCVPITPGGIGVAEATSSELFEQIGSANGAEMMLVVRLVMAALSLPALLLLFGGQPGRISSSAQPSGEPVEQASTTRVQPGRSRAA